MSGTADDVKGRAKEAAGALTDNDDLKREGKADQLVGSIKDKAEDAKNWVEEKVDEAKDRLQRKPIPHHQTGTPANLSQLPRTRRRGSDASRSNRTDARG